MLFLVISEPRPEQPSSVVAFRQRYWEWIAPLRASGEVRSVHARVGAGRWCCSTCLRTKCCISG